MLRFIAPIRLRHRWRDCLGVALLLGVTLAVAVFSIAGARRTQSSYDRFLRSVDSSDVSISQNGFDPAINTEVAALAGVVSARTYLGLRVVVYVDGEPDPSQFSEGVASLDGAFFDQDRFVASRGRVPDPRRADEVALNEVAARRYGYQVGQRLDLGIVDPAAFDEPSGAIDATTSLSTRSSVMIVGLGQFPDELMEDDADSAPRMLFTPAFTAKNVAAAVYNLQYLRLEHASSDLGTVQEHLRVVAKPGSVDLHNISLDRSHARRGLRPLSITLTIFGGIAIFVGSALGAMALVRLQRREADEAAVLMSLGTSPMAVRACSLIAPAVALLSACIIAVAISIVLSPWMPLGPVADLGGDTGIDLDLTVIGFGVAIAALFCVAILVLAACRAHPSVLQRSTTPRHSGLVGRAASVGVSPAFQTGVGMTFDNGITSRAVPMRSVIAGTALAVATLVIALGFATNLHDLTRNPTTYGWNWDVSLRAGQGFGNLDPEQTASILTGDSDVEAWSTVYLGDDVIGGTDVPLMGMTPSAAVRPPLLHGRFIADADEIVLGASTAASLHAAIGDVVAVGSAPLQHQLRVVGLAILPSIGGQHVLHPSLGVGAIVAPERIPGVGDQPGEEVGPQLAFIRFQTGSDHAAARRHLGELTKPLVGIAGLDILIAQRPTEIATTASLGNIPVIVAGSLAGAMSLAFAVALIASVRRRGHDLAVLRTLGFNNRQLTSTIAWHAYTTVAAGLIIGVPVGVIGSTWLWRAFADELDLAATDHLSRLTIVVIITTAMIVASLAAIAPALRAQRLTLSTVLRSE